MVGGGVTLGGMSCILEEATCSHLHVGTHNMTKNDAPTGDW